MDGFTTSEIVRTVVVVKIHLCPSCRRSYTLPTVQGLVDGYSVECVCGTRIDHEATGEQTSYTESQ